MKLINAASRTVFVAVVALSTGASALAENAQEMVQSLTKEQASLLAAHPALTKIDAVIRSDCATKSKGKLASSDFCGCAAALTMSLWRTGADPNMIPRLNEYLKNPTDAGATDFLKYQGPELYSGVCQAATKG